jgi:hypothetical protein
MHIVQPHKKWDITVPSHTAQFCNSTFNLEVVQKHNIWHQEFSDTIWDCCGFLLFHDKEPSFLRNMVVVFFYHFMTRNWHTNLTSRVSWDMRLLWLSYHSHDRELARLFCRIVHHLTKSEDDCIMKTKSAFLEALTQGHWPGLRFSSLTGKWLELSLLGGMNSSNIQSWKTARQKNSQCTSFGSTLQSWYILPWMRWPKCKLSDIIVPRD